MLAGMGFGGVAYSGKQAGEGLKATFEGETKVTKERRKKLSDWDRMLKNFRYGDALDSVLRKDVTPATTFALMEELVRRDGLAIALANRHDVSLEPVLSFLVKHVTDARYCTLAADVASVLIGETLAGFLSFSDMIETMYAHSLSTQPSPPQTSILRRSACPL